MDDQTWSKLVLGNRARLGVGALVAKRSDYFTCRQLAAELRIADSIVRSEVLHFLDAGLVEEFESPVQGRFFLRVEANHPFWTFCVEMSARFEEPAADAANDVEGVA